MAEIEKLGFIQILSLIKSYKILGIFNINNIKNNENLSLIQNYKILGIFNIKNIKNMENLITYCL